MEATPLKRKRQKQVALKIRVTMTYDQQRSQENTMSVLWYQKAAETKALYLQGYNVATDRLKEILQTPF